MRFLSASQDFQQSLNALPKLLRRLQYVSELHEAASYEHWGLARVHGKPAAERAMQEAHEGLFVELLRTPLRELAGSTTSPEEITALRVPEGLAGGSQRHFNSIMMALRYFSEQARAHPGA